jgi:carbonic anhydrase/acetyltransferase-like protein (isoleucine patch superfamily)
VIDMFAVVAASAVVMPGVTIGTRALVAAHACVTRNVPPDMVAAGVPARVIGPASAIRLRGANGEAAYPWTTHFHRGYPEPLVRSWLGAEAPLTAPEQNDAAR